MKKKKAPRRYKPGELVHDAFRMKTREESQPGVCVGVYKDDGENWTLCASPRAKHGQTDRPLCDLCRTRRDGEVRRGFGGSGRPPCPFPGCLKMSHSEAYRKGYCSKKHKERHVLMMRTEGEDVTPSYWTEMATGVATPVKEVLERA